MGPLPCRILVKPHVWRPLPWRSDRHGWCVFAIHPGTEEDGMGRHTKQADDEPSQSPRRLDPEVTAPIGRVQRPPAGNVPAVPAAYDDESYDEFAEEDEPAKSQHHFHWLFRVPLLPALAGVAAVGVVAAALGTSQINLNFGSPGAQTSSGQCGASACD